MIEMTKLLKVFLLIGITFFAMVILLMIVGKLTFGYGLGDLFYLFIQGAWLISLIIVFIITKRKNKIESPYALILSFIICISILFSIHGFTIGRGSEYPWNGRIFMISYKEYLLLEEEKFQNRIDSLNQEITKTPSDFKIISTKGYLYNEKEKWDLAIDEFNKALRINPEYFDALYGLGESYIGKGKYEKAVREFEKAKLIDSTREDISTRIKNLKEYHKIE